MSATEWPVAWWEEADDERSEGVLLLERLGDEDKVTAQRFGEGWRITDWELIDDPDNGKYWFVRSFHSIPDRYIAVIAKAAGAKA